MSVAEREIRIVKEQQQPKVDSRSRMEIKRAMDMIRFHVKESPNRETDEYLLRELRGQCKTLTSRLHLEVG